MTVALGQRVFDQAPLLFVGLSIVERGRHPAGVHVLRPATGSGEEGLADAVRAGGQMTERATIERLALRPFLPAAPTAVLALAGRGPRVGDLFASFDGVWTGDNARDTRYWWELPPGADGWRALSGGQGNEAWDGPIRRRIRTEHAAGQQRRAGGIEYARVAGGRLAARLVTNGAAALAGIVTLVPRSSEAEGRVEEVLAIFNSRIGAAWLRTLSSGLNFNPGYAAEIPLGPEQPPLELRRMVRDLVGLRGQVACGDPTADAFIDTVPPWMDDPLPDRIAALEREIEERLADHLGLGRDVLASLDPVTRPARRVDPLADHLGVRVLRLLGFIWPDTPRTEASEQADRPSELVPGSTASVRQIADRLGLLLEHENAPSLDIDLREWVGQRFVSHHAARFRRRPVVIQTSQDRLRLVRAASGSQRQ